MTDIVDGNIVVLAPKEGHGVERRLTTEHIAGCGLALSLGDNPMLDANGLARMAIRPSRDITRSVDAGRTGLQILIDSNAPVEIEAGLLGERQSRPHSDADDYQIRFDR